MLCQLNIQPLRFPKNTVHKTHNLGTKHISLDKIRQGLAKYVRYRSQIIDFFFES